MPLSIRRETPVIVSAAKASDNFQLRECLRSEPWAGLVPAEHTGLLLVVFEYGQRIRCKTETQTVCTRPALPFPFDNLATPFGDPGFQ